MWQDVVKSIKKEVFIKFLKRSGIFLGVLLAEIIVLTMTVDFQDIYLDQIYIYTEAHFVILFFLVIFGIITFRDIIKIDFFKDLNYKIMGIFLAVNGAVLFAFYKLNQYILVNSELVFQNPIFYAISWYLLAIAVVVSLLFAFYDFHFLKEFATVFKKQLGLSTVISLLFYVGIKQSVKLWPFFSGIVAKAVYFMLNLFFKGATINLTAEGVPVVGIPAITAQIYAACSGLEGMGLFIALFTVLTLTEYKILNLKRVFILLPIGILGAFAINILRTFLIYVMGHFISVDFAVGTFHSNVGWIAFTLYFLVFTYYTFPWMRKS